MAYPQFYLVKPDEPIDIVPVYLRETEDEVEQFKYKAAKQFARSNSKSACQVCCLPDEWVRHFIRTKKRLIAQNGLYGCSELDKWSYKVSAAQIIQSITLTFSDSSLDIVSDILLSVLHPDAQGVAAALHVAKQRRENFRRLERPCSSQSDPTYETI